MRSPSLSEIQTLNISWSAFTRACPNSWFQKTFFGLCIFSNIIIFHPTQSFKGETFEGETEKNCSGPKKLEYYSMSSPRTQKTLIALVLSPAWIYPICMLNCSRNWTKLILSFRSQSSIISIFPFLISWLKWSFDAAISLNSAPESSGCHSSNGVAYTV